MPAHLIPRNSGLHRIAAIALYRSLLTQAKHTTLAVPHRDELQNLIRTRFKQARFDTSQRHLKLRFAAGYEALDVLDTAVADRNAAPVIALLDRAPAAAKLAPQTVLPKHLRRELEKRERKQVAEADAARKAGQISLFERPLPLEKLSGRRHVPVMVRANFVPMLRLKKPQPESLSRYIRQRVATRQRRHDRRQALEGQLRVARWEDQWDAIVAQRMEEGGNGKEGVGGRVEEGKGAGDQRIRDGVKWSTAVAEALQQVQADLAGEKVRFRAMVVKMQGVVDREQELYEREKKARGREKKKKKAFVARERVKREMDRELREVERAMESEAEEAGEMGDGAQMGV